MDINRGKMAELFQGFQQLFKRGFEAAPSEYKQFSNEIRSTTAVEVYPYLEQFGGMREWIGDRQLKHVSSQNMKVANRDFEDSVVVRRNDIEDDKYGLYSTLVETMGFNANRIWADLAYAALLGGNTDSWIDALAFFSSTRKYGDESTIDNYGTDALSMESYGAARLKMLQYKGHNGKSLRVKPGLLIVGPRNEGVAFDILKNQRRLTAEIVGSGENAKTLTGAIENRYAGTAEVLVSTELDKEWFLADVSSPVKPVAVQKRREPKLTRLDSDNDENVVMRGEYIYCTDARGEAFLTLPHLIHGSFPS